MGMSMESPLVFAGLPLLLLMGIGACNGLSCWSCSYGFDGPNCFQSGLHTTTCRSNFETCGVITQYKQTSVNGPLTLIDIERGCFNKVNFLSVPCSIDYASSGYKVGGCQQGCNTNLCNGWVAANQLQ